MYEQKNRVHVAGEQVWSRVSRMRSMHTQRIYASRGGKFYVNFCTCVRDAVVDVRVDMDQEGTDGGVDRVADSSGEGKVSENKDSISIKVICLGDSAVGKSK